MKQFLLVLTGLWGPAMLFFSCYDLYNRFCHQNPWQYPSPRVKEIHHDANVAIGVDSVADSCAGDSVAVAVDKDAVKYVVLMRKMWTTT